MSNMSYCRFNNTCIDLIDCITALEDREISSDEEKTKAKKMLKTFLEFCEYEGIIEGYSEKAIDDLIKECE